MITLVNKRKKFLSLVVTGLLFVLSTSLFSQTQPNLVNNPSFENGSNGKPDNWTAVNYGDATLSWTNAVSHSGNYSISIGNIDNTGSVLSKWISDYITVSPGTAYELSLWYYVNKSYSSDQYFSVGLNQYDSNGNLIRGGFYSGNMPTPNQWTEFFTDNRTILDAKTVKVRYEIIFSNNNHSFDGTAYFDDMELRQVYPIVSLILNAPKQSDTLVAHSTYNIQWTSQNITAVNITAYYYVGTNFFTLPIALEIPASLGSYSWAIPDSLPSNIQIFITDSYYNDYVTYVTVFTVKPKYLMILSCKNMNAGAVRYGQPKDTIIAITNNGNDNIVISNITSNNISFTARPSSFTITPGITVKDTIRFIPSKFGVDSSKIIITSNAPSSPDTVVVTAISPPPVLTSLKASISYGNSVQNTTKKDTIKIVNNSINTLIVDSIFTKTGAFKVDCSNGTVTIDIFKIVVSFTPTALGSYGDTVYLHNNSTTPLVKIPLSGNCPMPVLTSLKASISYGSVAKNTTNKDTIKIVNNSINMLTVDSIYTKISAFTVDKISGTVGIDTLKLVVSFMPAAFTSYTDTVYLRNNSATPLVNIPLSGYSPTPVLSSSTTSLAFSNRAICDSVTMTAYLKNASINVMSISGITTTTSNFTASSGSTTVAGGDSTILMVKFKPTAFGTFTDTVTVVSDGGTLKVALSGNSPLPIFTSLKTSISYGSVAKTITKKDTVKITNNSINTLNMDSIYTKTSAFSVDRISGTVGTDTMKIVVSFTPATLASYRDTVYLRNNSSTPLVKIPLSGMCPKPLLTASALTLTLPNQAKGNYASLTTYLKNQSINLMTITNVTTKTNIFQAYVDSTTVAGLDSTVLTVIFWPDALGTFTDTVTIVSDGGTAKIPLVGSSPYPTLVTNKTSLAFGDVAKNATKKDTIKIFNTSINKLTIDTIYTKTSAFTVNQVNGTVGTDTLNIVVSFTPTLCVSLIDTVYLQNKSATPLVKIPLSGNAPAPILASRTSNVSFGTVKKDILVIKNIYITNSSISALSIDSLYTMTKYFTVGAVKIPAIVNMGDTFVVAISFKPDTVKMYLDTLYIKNNSNTSLAKVSLIGIGSLTAVQALLSGIPKQYELSQNYPNPFNPSTTIQYALPSRSQVRLRIYNLLGQVLAELVNTEQSAGFQSVAWNAPIASGMYFYRIEATEVSNTNNRFVDTKRMMLLK